MVGFSAGLLTPVLQGMLAFVESKMKNSDGWTYREDVGH